jgi:hypothetical protein
VDPGSHLDRKPLGEFVGDGFRDSGPLVLGYDGGQLALGEPVVQQNGQLLADLDTCPICSVFLGLAVRAPETVCFVS